MNVGKIMLLLLLVWACSPKQEFQYTEGRIYGTFYHISYASAEDLQQEIRQEMEKVNASLSMFNPASVIARINRGESDSTDVLFRRMFVTAQQVHRMTEGAYDITVAPLVNAWGFGTEERSFPDSARIDSLMAVVGMDKVVLENDKVVMKAEGMQLDASSIAKGLGVDLVADFLDSRGIQDYMVEIGGEIRAKGLNTKRQPWRIGIDRPVDDVNATEHRLQLILGMTSGAVATSGNYRNYYMHEGKKYAHTINPKTGFPVQTEIVGSTVLAPECMEADAYATAFMVTGLKEAQRIVQQQPELEACLIYVEKGELKTWISEGMKGKIISQEN